MPDVVRETSEFHALTHNLMEAIKTHLVHLYAAERDDLAKELLDMMKASYSDESILASIHALGLTPPPAYPFVEVRLACAEGSHVNTYTFNDEEAARRAFAMFITLGKCESLPDLPEGKWTLEKDDEDWTFTPKSTSQTP